MRQLLRVIPGFFHRLLSPPVDPEWPPDPDWDPGFLDGKGPRHLAHHPPPADTTALLLPVCRLRRQ